MTIQGKQVKELVIVNSAGEVVAVISDHEVIEKVGYKAVIR